MVVDLYTDGACSGNPGPGGWGWVTVDGRSGKGGAPHTTNQRMEIQAVIEGLAVIEGGVNVVSDSTYVVKCFNDRWFEGWLKRGWKNSQKKPVANRDLWEPLIETFLEREDELTFTWVKGHSGNKFNEIADELAVEARDSQTAGLAVASAELDSTVVPWPTGQAIWTIGSAEISRDLLAKLDQAIASLDEENDVLVSGLRRGVELAAGEAALRHGVQLAAVLPFADPASGWPAEVRQRFDDACDQSAWLVTLSGDPSAPGKAVEARDRWLENAVVGVIVVCDPKAAGDLDALGLSVVHLEED